MATLIIAIILICTALGIWGTISFWTDGAYKRNRPDQDLSGFRRDGDG
ncbi:hypothetical protein [Gordonia sp. (in: high G+C Gram-positive bacteria)]|nr:hypothetical protein [Gordonia sp. (in: high G+C Gram-positive bacteria)]MCB1293484.1 hypothetical protein [Gordonia sp. (in: high G+C Gram-positive bacteria)]HMS76659.1 hypothetical protein [Gordonia sp. (in: high G+C Gram-positive bacteria)]HQV20828.1 hypothetical protein [Gordonia sp. (in: high G+C Gram-positive bacteria)]